MRVIEQEILAKMSSEVRNDPLVAAVLTECRLQAGPLQTMHDTLFVLVRSLFEDRKRLLAHCVHLANELTGHRPVVGVDPAHPGGDQTGIRMPAPREIGVDWTEEQKASVPKTGLFFAKPGMTFTPDMEASKAAFVPIEGVNSFSRPKEGFKVNHWRVCSPQENIDRMIGDIVEGIRAGHALEFEIDQEDSQGLLDSNKSPTLVVKCGKRWSWLHRGKEFADEIKLAVVARMPDIRNPASIIGERIARENAARLEEQAKAFLAEGWETKDLCIVQEDGKPDRMEAREDIQAKLFAHRSVVNRTLPPGCKPGQHISLPVDEHAEMLEWFKK